MKRSEINQLIVQAKSFFDKMNFKLPPWALWSPENWKGKYDQCQEIVENMLGWDLTDFGSGVFNKRGLILFTIRNGNIIKDHKPYCEKIMIADIMQETPMHFHWFKMEDIINRGGGDLAMELYLADQNENLSKDSFIVKIDGVNQTLKAGSKIFLKPGESICLEKNIYHRFWGEKDKVLIGEVSCVNDDSTDNRFFETIGRFPDIIEDQSPLHS